MPDFERITRQLEIDLEPTTELKEKKKAYFKGLDRGRIECVIIVSCIIAYTLIKVL